MVKTCTKCGKAKRGDQFRQYGRACRACLNRANRAYYATNSDRLTELARQKYAADPAAAHARDLLRRYGITAGDYADTLGAQDGACAICGQVDSTGRRPRHRCRSRPPLL